MIWIFRRSIVAYIPFSDGDDVGAVSIAKVFVTDMSPSLDSSRELTIWCHPNISRNTKATFIITLKSISPASPGMRLIWRIAKFFVQVETSTFSFVLTRWHHHCPFYIHYHHHIYHLHNFTFTTATMIGSRNIIRVTQTDAEERIMICWNRTWHDKDRNMTC